MTEQIARLAQQAGNDRLRLLAVSKVHSIDKIRDLYAVGHNYFGENYVQELAEKAEACADLPLRWSFIGHLQSNKIKTLVRYASDIQTLASMKHAHLIEKAAITYSKTPFPVYVACNPEDEPGKNGLSCHDVLPFVASLKTQCPHLRLMGLMSIPPRKYQDSLQEVPELYRALRKLANQVGEGRLSLGMSGDLKIAIKAGSNLVRIGSSIFGTRPQKARQP